MTTFNNLGQMTVQKKSLDRSGNVFPSTEFCEGKRPGVGLRVAPYLPVQLQEKNEENWYVISQGKGIALDKYGYIIPAGLGVSGATLVYSATDVSLGTIDITTGAAVTAGKTVTISDIDGSTSDFLGVSGDAFAASKFIGYAGEYYYKNFGDYGTYDDGLNPAGFTDYNYNLQSRYSIGCDYVLQLPQVPAQTATESMTFGAPSSGVSTSTALSNLPVAKNTQRTTMTFADGGSGHSSLFVTEKGTAAEVLMSGDWHINLTTGVVTVYSGSVTPTGVTLTYYNYASAPTGSSVSKFACALGDLVPGDFLKYNVDSNYIKATSGVDADMDICGQVIKKITYPMAGLDKVKTAHSSLNTSGTGALPGYNGQLDQYPGTATGGVDLLTHYAGAANTIVVVNFFNR